MADVGFATRQERVAFVLTFLDKYPEVPTWKPLRLQALWVSTYGTSEEEAKFWEAFRRAVKSEKDHVAGLAATHYELALRTAMRAAVAKHGTAFAQAAHIMHWTNGIRAMRLLDDIEQQIALANKASESAARLSHARIALVNSRELFRIVNEAFSPARHESEPEAAYKARIHNFLLAGRTEIPTYLNLAWAKLPLKLAKVRNAMSHGDVRVVGDKLEIYDQEEPAEILVTLDEADVKQYIAVAAATWEAIYADMLYRVARTENGVARVMAGKPA